MSNVETNATTRKAADHSYIDTSGNKVERIEQAAGIKYVDLRTGGGEFAYIVPDAAPGSVQTMLAIFGAKTLATNSASAARQARDKGADDAPANDVAGIAERFDELAEGQWAERAEGAPRGPKYDREVLADVLAQQKSAKGDKAHYMQRLEQEKGLAAKVMRFSAISQAYYKAKGQEAPSLDSVL